MKAYVLLAAALAASAVTPAMVPAAAVESASPQAAADALLAADRGFSAAGEKAVLVDALAAMFDEDVIMPVPNGTFAKGKAEAVAALKANPANNVARASWAPIRVGISGDGKHGFSYGFMTIREDGKPDRRAKYLAYWVKRPEGWRVAAYKRAVSADGTVQSDPRPAALPERIAASAPDGASVSQYEKSLAAAEKAFSDEAQRIGVGPAFKNNGSADAMNMGPGHDFIYGNETIGTAVGGGSNEPATIHWAADERVIVAGSGDLGVSIGYIRANAAPPAGQPAALPFFTVWRRASPQQPWRYIAE